MTHTESRFDKLSRDQQQLIETLRARRSTDYTPPADAMAPLAAMLIGNPNLHGHALVQHIISTKGRDYAVALFQHLAKEAEK